MDIDVKKSSLFSAEEEQKLLADAMLDVSLFEKEQLVPVSEQNCGYVESKDIQTLQNVDTSQYHCNKVYDVENDFKMFYEILQRKRGLIGPEYCDGSCCFIYSRSDCKKRGPMLKDCEKELEDDIRVVNDMFLFKHGLVGPELCYGSCCYIYSGPNCKHRDGDAFSQKQEQATVKTVTSSFKKLSLFELFKN